MEIALLIALIVGGAAWVVNAAIKVRKWESRDRAERPSSDD